MAIPGQGGVGHINCRPKQYWHDKLISCGLTHEKQAEEKLIEHCRSGIHMGWFINNVIVCKNNSYK